MPTINLQQIQTQQERAILKAFMSSVQSVKDQAVISEIANLITLGRIEDVVELLQLDPATFRPLENATLAAYEIGGATGAAQIGRIPTNAGTLVARFNVRNPRAEAFIRDVAQMKMVEMTSDAQDAVRGVLLEGLKRGDNPKDVALDLIGRIDTVTKKRVGGHIGLTRQQTEWIVNARSELETLNSNYLTRKLRDRRMDGLIKRAIDSGEKLTAKQINMAITRMQAKTLKYRAEVIARTEAVTSLRAGQHEAIMQAAEKGELEKEFAQKVWNDTGDGKTRPSHGIADGQSVPVDQPFIVGGERLMFPGDPNGSKANIIQCRCHARYKMDFAGQAARDIRGFG